jgi:nucleotide-binding universal stress UspA family protein
VLAVAIDGDDQSEVIVPAAARMAGALGMTLCLLQVVVVGAEGLVGDAAKTAYLSHVAAHIPGFDADEVDDDVLHGRHAAHDLADYVATRCDVGLIALATRGRSGRDRLFHGSTAFELAHRAAVPVVMLHEV